MVIAALSMALVFCAITAVAAKPSAPDTPLYTFRMEEASSEMNFFPKQKSNFTYTAEKVYTVDFAVSAKYCDAGTCDIADT